MSLVPAADAARLLGVTRRRVSDLWRSGELHGRKHSAGLLIDLASVHEREAIGVIAGRPWGEDIVIGVISALSGDAASRSGVIARRIVANDVQSLGRHIAAAVTTTRFEARHPERLRRALALTGESAIDRLGSTPGDRLLGDTAIIRGYAKDGIAALAEEHDLVESFSGPVVVHAFRSGVTRVDTQTPRALVAADCLRSDQARVRRLGLDALRSMRASWLSSTI